MVADAERGHVSTDRFERGDGSASAGVDVDVRGDAGASTPSPGAVVDMPAGTSCQFEPELESVRAARRFALDAARQWGVTPRELALVVGELATNAVVHGHTPFTVSLTVHERTVSIEVSDEDVAPVRRSAVSPEDQSGRGLLIVDRLATSWGIRPVAEDGKVVGKVVWAELDD
jgi:anti-sigma regulatory factor (Ser/Thr protein kinase)